MRTSGAGGLQIVHGQADDLLQVKTAALLGPAVSACEPPTAPPTALIYSESNQLKMQPSKGFANAAQVYTLEWTSLQLPDALARLVRRVERADVDRACTDRHALWFYLQLALRTKLLVATPPLPKFYDPPLASKAVNDARSVVTAYFGLQEKRAGDGKTLELGRPPEEANDVKNVAGVLHDFVSNQTYVGKKALMQEVLSGTREEARQARYVLYGGASCTTRAAVQGEAAYYEELLLATLPITHEVIIKTLVTELEWSDERARSIHCHETLEALLVIILKCACDNEPNKVQYFVNMRLAAFKMVRAVGTVVRGSPLIERALETVTESPGSYGAIIWPLLQAAVSFGGTTTDMCRLVSRRYCCRLGSRGRDAVSFEKAILSVLYVLVHSIIEHAAEAAQASPIRRGRQAASKRKLAASTSGKLAMWGPYPAWAKGLPLPTSIESAAPSYAGLVLFALDYMPGMDKQMRQQLLVTMLKEEYEATEAEALGRGWQPTPGLDPAKDSDAMIASNFENLLRVLVRTQTCADAYKRARLMLTRRPAAPQTWLTQALLAQNAADEAEAAGEEAADEEEAAGKKEPAPKSKRQGKAKA